MLSGETAVGVHPALFGYGQYRLPCGRGSGLLDAPRAPAACRESAEAIALATSDAAQYLGVKAIMITRPVRRRTISKYRPHMPILAHAERASGTAAHLSWALIPSSSRGKARSRPRQGVVSSRPWQRVRSWRYRGDRRRHQSASAGSDKFLQVQTVTLNSARRGARPRSQGPKEVKESEHGWPRRPPWWRSWCATVTRY